METRKIQTVGGGTYTVSLPKEWAESLDLSAGSVVTLHTHIDDLLVVQPADTEQSPAESVTVDLDGDERAVERAIRAAYAAGIDEVELVEADGLTDPQRRAIQRVARNLTGVTVTTETDTRATVRTMLDAAEVSVRQSVRQLQFVALSMHRDAMDALVAGRGIESPGDRDDQADRLYALVDRYFGRGLARLDEIDALGLTRPELFALWLTARELERVADHAERIAVVGDRLDDSPPDWFVEDLRPLGETAQEVVADAVSVAIGDAGVETARDALEARDRARDAVTDLERCLFESSGTDYRLTTVLDSLRRTAEHGGNVAELGVKSAVRNGSLRSPF